MEDIKNHLLNQVQGKDKLTYITQNSNIFLYNNAFETSCIVGLLSITFI